MEGRQPLRLDQKPIIWQDFSQKLHQNERNWTKRGARVPRTPLDPPMHIIYYVPSH